MNIIPIFIPHLGCPNDCVFCNQKRIAAPMVPTAEQVRRQIEEGLQYGEHPEIAYYGGSFTAIEPHLMEAYLQTAYAFVQSGKAAEIRISTRPDCIDEDVLHILKQYGVGTIELGAQSMCDGVLKESRRGHTAQQVVAASRLILQQGFHLGLQMMIGLPLDNREKTMQTAKEIAALHPHFVRIYPTCVIRDTELADRMQAGSYVPITVEQAVEMSAEVADVFCENHIPIIRIGLNPTEELSAGGVLAGGYHPALGELVRARQLRHGIARRLACISPQPVDIWIHPKDSSFLYGRKKAEYRYLQKMFPNFSIGIVCTEQVNRGFFRIIPGIGQNSIERQLQN